MRTWLLLYLINHKRVIMKKALLIFCIFLLTALNVNAMIFEEAFNQVDRKPMLVLVYANWAENYRDCLASFNNLQNIFGDTFSKVREK